MLRYAVNRALFFIPTLLGMTAVTFVIMQLTPGSPFSPSAANGITPEMIAELERKYGLDKPLYERFALYVWNSLHSDFGVSYQYRPQEVRDIIVRTFPVSLQLGTMAVTVAIIVGMTLGILAAVNQNGIIDYLSVTFAILFYSMPNFVMGFLLILGFAVWLPNFGIDFGFRVSGWEGPKDWVLPTIALGAAPLATLARYTRSSMIDVIRSDYVRTARAKGLAERKVILKHVLKNALIPVVTLIGPIFAAVGTGSFFVEQVFNIPGMGRYYVESMQTKDQPMILAVTLIFGIFLAFMNLLVDIAYGLIDPRIRY
ncbi:MAG: oligopeptide transport system permease protein [Thermomicrobiales bacterium]|nr:oligopeptide transport system permease protein [Thermomicrobiales bacterium]